MNVRHEIAVLQRLGKRSDERPVCAFAGESPNSGMQVMIPEVDDPERQLLRMLRNFRGEIRFPHGDP